MEETLLAKLILLGITLTITGYYINKFVGAVRRHPFIQYLIKCIRFRRWFGSWPQEGKQIDVNFALEKLAVRYLFYAELEPRISQTYQIFSASRFNVADTAFRLFNKEIRKVTKIIQHQKRVFWGPANLARDFGFEVKESAWNYVKEADPTKTLSQE